MSYTQVISGFSKDFSVSKGKNSRCQQCLFYLLIILTIDITFTVLSLEVYANYIYLIITSIFIGKYKALGYLKGFNFSLTILACFQWVVVFVGSFAFLVLPHEWLTDNALYLAILYSAHLAVAFLLYKFRFAIFKHESSKKLQLIDIGAKIFFIAFFNLIFPNYFEYLGMVNYATLALILLIIALIFVIYREYSVALEKKLAVYNSNQLTVLHYAMQNISKYERYSGIQDIQSIENPIVQSLLYELKETGDRLGLLVEISVNGHVGNINLNNYDLHITLESFLSNALDEAKTSGKRPIITIIDYIDNIFTFTIHVIAAPGTLSIANYRLEKDAALIRMKANENITIDISRTDGFKQVLRVEY